MKPLKFLSIIMFTLSLSAISQNAMELTFTAENNSQRIVLDSILIENQTQGGDTTLYPPDTVLLLEYPSNIATFETIGNRSFIFSQNYPNPFEEITFLDLILVQTEKIKITVQDIFGRELTNYKNTLTPGNHTFSIYSSNEKYYLLTVSGEYTSKTIKMMSLKSNTNPTKDCKIIYKMFKGNNIESKTQVTINSFVYSQDDSLKYTAYTDVEREAITDKPVTSQTYIFQFKGWTPCHDVSTVYDIENNSYNTVQIGSQCWLKENLKTTKYQNGIPIPYIADNDLWNSLTFGAYTWYENDIKWKELYGAYYNWYTTIDTNGLCPTGWHVPSIDEWIELTDYIGGTNKPYGSELKSCRQVNSPEGGNCNTDNHPRWDEYTAYFGTDDYGLSVLPGGDRHYNGEFDYMGQYAYLWSTSVSSWNPNYAKMRGLGYDFGNVGNHSDHLKLSGFSVRCIKD